MQTKDQLMQPLIGGAKKAAAVNAHVPGGLKQLQSMAGNTRFGRAWAGAAKKPEPTELPATIRQGVERLSGVPLHDVRVHYDSPAPAQLGALAYTKGTDIHIAPGQQRHLAHEAWHAVQQREGRVSTPHTRHGEEPVREDSGLEQEADQTVTLLAAPEAGGGAVEASEEHGGAEGVESTAAEPVVQMKKPEWYEAHPHAGHSESEHPRHDCGCPVGSATFAVPGGRVAIGLRKARVLYRDDGHREGEKQPYRPDPPLPNRWWPQPEIVDPPDPDLEHSR